MQILKKLYCFLFCFTALTSWGQDYFYKVYSSGNFDIGEGVCQLPDSSYLVTGSSGGFNTTSPQAFVMKVSKTGKQLWTVNKGGEEAETGRRIFYLNDTIYLFGRTNSFGNSYDYYFLKLDTLGQTISEQTLGTADFEWLQDVVFLPKDSTFVLYGYWQENNGFERKRQVLKVNRQGAILWQRDFPMHLEAQLKNAHAITDSTFAITGSEYNENRQKFDGLFYSFDLAGNLIDSLRYFQDTARGYCFNDFALGNGYILIAANGSFINNEEIFMDYLTIRFNTDTDEAGVSAGGIGNTYFTSLEYIVRKKNNPDMYYMVERAKKTNLPTFGDGYWDEQIYLYRDNFGGLLWEKGITNVSSLGNDITNQMITTLDNGIVSVGYNEYFANGTQNVFLLKVASNDNAVAPNTPPTVEKLLEVTANNQALQLSVFPNPVENIITISSDEDLEISIIDLNGKHCLSTTSKNIDVSMLQSGVYFLQVNANQSSRVIKFVKK